MNIKNIINYFNSNRDINKIKNNKREIFFIDEIDNKNLININESILFNRDLDSMLEILNNLDESLFSKKHIDEIKKIIIDVFSDNSLVSNESRLEVLETKLKYYAKNNMNDKEREKFLKIFDDAINEIMTKFDEYYDGEYYSTELLFEVLNNIRIYKEKFNNDDNCIF